MSIGSSNERRVSNASNFFFLLSNQANLALEIMLSFDVGSMVLYIEIDLRVDQVFDCKFDFTTHIGLYVMRN